LSHVHLMLCFAHGYDDAIFSKVVLVEFLCKRKHLTLSMGESKYLVSKLAPKVTFKLWIEF
jgi:hypothetical protein